MIEPSDGIKPGDVLMIETDISALVGVVLGVQDDAVLIEGSVYPLDEEDDNVIRSLAHKQAVKNKTPYRYNAEIAADIPRYDIVKRRHIPAGFDQDNPNAVAYKRFEVVPSNNKIASIVGVAPDGARIKFSTTTVELANALADAYNRGGFTDQDIQKVRFDEVKQRLDPKCWSGYRKQGTKVKDGVRVNNCVKINEDIDNTYALLDAIEDIVVYIEQDCFDSVMHDFDDIVVYCQNKNISMQDLVKQIEKGANTAGDLQQSDYQKALKELSRFGTVFNKYKTYMIRAFLTRINDNIDLLTVHDIKENVEALKYFGANWTELDQIAAAAAKSLPTTLDENDMDEEEEELYYDAINYMDNLYHSLTDKKWRSAANYLSELGMLYQEAGVYLPDAIDMVTDRRVKMHIEKLYGLLDSNKEDVLRGILTMIKTGQESATSISNLITVLDEFGADWPELDALEAAVIKSLPNKLDEAEYQGRKVQLGKPQRGDVKKYKVFVKDPKTGNIKKVNFGDPNMEIKRDDPERRKNFRARHGCGTPRASDRTKAAYWSCRLWSTKKVSDILKGKK